MPKLRHPDGHIVSVSRAGMDVLRSRGYTDIAAPAADVQQAAANEAKIAAQPDPPAEPVELERPAESAVKADWVAYAEAQGVENAASLTKAELVERFTEGD